MAPFQTLLDCEWTASPSGPAGLFVPKGLPCWERRRLACLGDEVPTSHQTYPTRYETSSSSLSLFIVSASKAHQGDGRVQTRG